MTATREKVWNAIAQLRSMHQEDPERSLWPPTVDEIAKQAGVNIATAHSNLIVFQRYGFIRRRQGVPRSLQIICTDVPPVKGRARRRSHSSSEVSQ